MGDFVKLLIDGEKKTHAIDAYNRIQLVKAFPALADMMVFENQPDYWIETLDNYLRSLDDVRRT